MIVYINTFLVGSNKSQLNFISNHKSIWRVAIIVEFMQLLINQLKNYKSKENRQNLCNMFVNKQRQ